ncbi:MAG: cation-translocating P-type ATPase, partial [Rhodobacteraceae bacterium]|nr:cation-translocating P-type ATPase [Paracoccaceae bacterium]
MSRAAETFALPDARCGGCIVKIERTLCGLTGVEHARGNATQKRIHVIWDDVSQSVDTLRHAIRDLGYTAELVGDSAPKSDGHGLMSRLCVAGFAMMNVMALSLSVWFGVATDMGGGTMQFLHWIAAALALPVMLYSGWVFHRGAIAALWRRRMTMDTPISIAIFVTYVASLVETIRGTEHVYFDAVIGLIFFLLIGRVLEQYMHQRSGDAAENLRGVLDLTATRLSADGVQTDVSSDELLAGDIVLLAAGDRIPADGVLMSSGLYVDESILTGECVPRQVRQGAPLVAGSFALDGPAQMRVTHVGSASQVGQLTRLADEVATHKGALQRASDRFASSYIPLVLVGGAVGFLGWYFILGAGFAQSLMIAISVLIVTCPCAAGLATPAVTARAMNLALSIGVVFKSGAALERLGACSRVFLDKTGTASVVNATLPAALEPDAHALLKRLAAHSNHPYSRMLSDGAIAPDDPDIQEIPGQGITGPQGSRLGHAAFVGAAEMSTTSLLYRDQRGKVWPIATTEKPRPGLRGFLAKMEERGHRVTLLSGDQSAAVGRFAKMAGLEFVMAGQSPEDKLRVLQAAQRDGASVLMIGDGLNDAIALGAADVSMSFAGATQIAQNVADVVVARADFRQVGVAVNLSADAARLIRQNLRFSLIYNLLAVPAALAGMLS